MRVLLLNPPGQYCRAGSRWPHKRKAKNVGIDYHPFPFALGYAAGRLREDGHEVRLVDCIATKVSPETLEEISSDFRHPKYKIVNELHLFPICQPFP